MADAEIISPRDELGRFRPGTTGNAGGRPSLPQDVREALEAGSLRAAQRLVQLLDSEDERVAAMAANSLFDRLYGRPTQSLDASVKQESVGAAHLTALMEIAERRRLRLEKEQAQRCDP
jgi:hypothetical protein